MTDVSRFSPPSSNGAARGPFSEIGLTGLTRGKGKTSVSEEFLRELMGERANKIYKEMRDNDPTVGAILFAIDKLIRQVEWRVEGEDSNEADVQFLEECMNDMSHTWQDFISECLSMLPFGWSYFEIVYKKRSGPQRQKALGAANSKTPSSKYSDGRIGWRKFSIRSQDTLADWQFDETGGIQGMWQAPPPDFVQRMIPIEKGLLFRTQSDKGNPQGRSFLRNGYRPWYFKKRIEEIEAIGVERDLAGFPVMHVDPQLLDPNAPLEYQQLASTYAEIIVNIRRDQQEGVLLPSVYDESGHELYRLELLTSGGARQFDTNGIIQRWDQRIAMTVLADFILLGHERVGSFALSSDKTDLFAVALGAVLDAIKSVLNDYAVPRLFALNGETVEDLPEIIYGDVEQQSLSELGAYLQALAAAGMPLFPNDELENHLLELADLPKKSEEQLAAEAVAPPPPTPEEGAQGGVPGSNQTEAEAESQPTPT
jgi:hypothetical protein